MQTITITPQFENGRFYFELPDDLKDSEITIQLIVKKAKSKPEEIKKRLEKVKAFAGIARDSDYEFDKDEWYNQCEKSL